jgi:hypothetical protein
VSRIFQRRHQRFSDRFSSFIGLRFDLSCGLLTEPLFHQCLGRSPGSRHRDEEVWRLHVAEQFEGQLAASHDHANVFCRGSSPRM